MATAEIAHPIWHCGSIVNNVVHRFILHFIWGHISQLVAQIKLRNAATVLLDNFFDAIWKSVRFYAVKYYAYNSALTLYGVAACFCP